MKKEASFVFFFHFISSFLKQTDAQADQHANKNGPCSRRQRHRFSRVFVFAARAPMADFLARCTSTTITWAAITKNDRALQTVPLHAKGTVCIYLYTTKTTTFLKSPRGVQSVLSRNKLFLPLYFLNTYRRVVSFRREVVFASKHCPVGQCQRV